MIITVSIPVTAAQVQAVKEAGSGTTIHHPRARTIAGRKQLARALTVAGVPPKIVKSLGWSTTGPAPKNEGPELGRDAEPEADQDLVE